MIGFTELMLIIGIVILLFGATQIPKVMKSLGEGIKEFKKAVKEGKTEDDSIEKKDKK